MKKFRLSGIKIQIAVCAICPLLVLTLGQSQSHELVKSFTAGSLGVLVGLMIGAVGILLTTVASMQNALIVRNVDHKRVEKTLLSISKYNGHLKCSCMLTLVAYFALGFYPVLTELASRLLAWFLREGLLPAWWFYGYLELVVLFLLLTGILDIARSMFILIESHSAVIKGVSGLSQRDSDNPLT